MFKLDLLANEQPVAVYRQSEAVLIKTVVLVFVLIYAPWFFFLKYEIADTYSRLLLFWTILVFLYAVNKYILWLVNSYVLTNKRLIILNYKNLLNKTVLESPVERILNVSFVSQGLMPALFGYGSVLVQVTGLTDPMVLENVSHPNSIKDFLWNFHAKNKLAK